MVKVWHAQSNHDEILGEIDKYFNRDKPPAVEYVFVEESATTGVSMSPQSSVTCLSPSRSTPGMTSFTCEYIDERRRHTHASSNI